MTDDLDMRALCQTCGTDMGPCDPRKMFCSQRCREIDRRDVEREATRETLANRRCKGCGGIIGDKPTQSHATYCSKACYPPNWYAGTRTCATCGGAFRAVNKHQRCCSVSCGQRLRHCLPRKG